MSFSRRLAETRISSGLSQYDMAKLTNLNRSTYSGYEQTNKEPSYETLSKIADALHVSVDYLLERDSVLPSIAERKAMDGESDCMRALDTLPDKARDASLELLNVIYDLIVAISKSGQYDYVPLYKKLAADILSGRNSLTSAVAALPDSEAITNAIRAQNDLVASVTDDLSALFEIDLRGAQHE